MDYWLNTQLNPTTCLGDTGCWIQQVTATTLEVTYRAAKYIQVQGKMQVGCWIQQVTTRIGTVTCWIQQPVSPKQVVGFTCVVNSEVDQSIRKFIVCVLPDAGIWWKWPNGQPNARPNARPNVWPNDPETTGTGSKNNDFPLIGQLQNWIHRWIQQLACVTQVVGSNKSLHQVW